MKDPLGATQLGATQLGATQLGATHLGGDRCHFLVWAPRARQVEVHILAPREQVVSLSPGEHGYYSGVVSGVPPGSLYLYRLDGEKERPDPASRAQPRGVHGPSQVVDSGAFPWEDQTWAGLSRANLVIYELHVGTFSPEGTFAGIIPHLDALKELGVTAIELMPVAQFPGERNWGYDGVYPFAVQDSYGGPAGLKQLVNACHQRGLGVFLDVVYNHLGPEGNYLAEYAPYFTDRYKTPWGPAINFDGPGSDEVRRYFIANALYWLEEYHIDGLRLDAVHAILDQSARPFLAELAEAVERRAEALGRRFLLIAESDLNDPRIIHPRALGGHGLDGQWADDFHHALHALLTGEEQAYYQDYGRVSQLAKAYREGYVYTGEYSGFRGRRHGRTPRPAPSHRFVAFAQNHDQVGNRMQGDRLSTLVSWEALKLAAGAVILSPFVPLLFMGEEYGETAPFQYFTSHTDPDLAAAVRRGRRQEFAAFYQEAGAVPDPQDPETFRRSRLQLQLREEGRHRVLREFYRELLRLRRELPALAPGDLQEVGATAFERERVLLVQRQAPPAAPLCMVLHFGAAPLTLSLPLPRGAWHLILDSAGPEWQGPGSRVPERLESDGAVTLTLQPHSVVLLGASTTGALDRGGPANNPSRPERD